MKFTAIIAAAASCMAVTTAHMALQHPVPRGGYNTPGYNGRIQAFITYHDKKYTNKFPCGGFPPLKKSQPMKAGEVINVRFASSFESKSQREDVNLYKKKPSSRSKEFDQPRHGGGTCEFSLSYDNGKTFGRIGRYTYSCPDAYEIWKVKIPDNVKECREKGKCLFVWTWLANTLPQWYMNCADIDLTNTKVSKNKQRQPKGNVALFPKGTKKTAPGDGNDIDKKWRERSGNGVLKKEEQENLAGKYVSWA
ncbi:hypothetical protein B0O80DRAFT_453757 [Mortierella sp. GBAus27b]|nr:hypothetical protein BGX31_003886 [Mortierella sp. GBA43]KAI8352720.1 hypothetical protein B0O80DRAFT_453757 [Mortierella sp. GBAus27b]